VHALAWCCAWALVPVAWGANLAESARKENCTDRPVSVAAKGKSCSFLELLLAMK